VDAIGYLLDIIVYFVIAIGSVAAFISHVDEKVPVPGASPWRIRSPKIAAAAGPVLLIAGFFAVAISSWLAVAVLIGSLAAPWVAGVLIVVEWCRRRAEDRATGLVRPLRLPGWSRH
jgi:hypothetical protein